MDFRQAAIQRLAMMGRGPKPGGGVMDGPFGDSQPVPTSMPGEVSVGQRSTQSAPAPAGQALGKQGMDPRSLLGMFSRGANVYNGAGGPAQSGPNVNMGRPSNGNPQNRMAEVAARRLQMMRGGR